MRLYPSQDGTEALQMRRKQRRLKRNPQPRDFTTLREYIDACQTVGKTPRTNPKKKNRPNLTPLEHVEQANLVKWVLLYRTKIPALKRFFAIPNQGAARLKNLQTEGVLRGVFDCFLAHPKMVTNAEGYAELKCGLFLELKRVKGGKVSREQMEFGAEMQTAGYTTAICRGAEEAWQAIMDYLGIPDPR